MRQLFQLLGQSQSVASVVCVQFRNGGAGLFLFALVFRIFFSLLGLKVNRGVFFGSCAFRHRGDDAKMFAFAGASADRLCNAMHVVGNLWNQDYHPHRPPILRPMPATQRDAP